MQPLATSTDVQAALRRALTTSEQMGVDALIDEASALFRLAAGQLFTPGTSTVWLTVNHGDVWLPEVPAVDVTDVRDRHDRALTYARNGQWLTGVCVAGGEQVQVTYSHGADTVPDLVRLRVAGIVATRSRTRSGTVSAPWE